MAWLFVSVLSTRAAITSLGRSTRFIVSKGYSALRIMEGQIIDLRNKKHALVVRNDFAGVVPASVCKKGKP
jgi:hypothetical protein